MDPLYLAISLVPLSVYLLAVGTVRASWRPTVISGGRDFLALAIGVSGFAVAGPLDLFLPETAVGMLGAWAWLPMAGLYLLGTLLVSLLLRPRLICWNVTTDIVRPIVEEELARLDSQRRWAGSCVWLPERQMQMSMESLAGVHGVQLVSVGRQQDLEVWRRLEERLKGKLASVRGTADPRGFVMVGLATGLLLLSVVSLLAQPAEVQIALEHFLRR